MCGISGAWNRSGNKINKQEFIKFHNTLDHRGPDATGIHNSFDNSLYLGSKRLSILDPSDVSNQPQYSEDKRYCVVFNGEIYNFLEVKKELIELGYKFKTTGDTEVLLKSYLHWGEKCQLKLDGMWSFAIWDDKEKVLFLSRDRFGEKPLFYMIKNNNFFFASELKSFVKLESINKPDFNYEYLNKFRDNEFGENTFLQNVKNLNAGHQINISSNQIKIKKWWDTNNFITDKYINMSFTEQAEYFKELIYYACKTRARSDVQIACALSGGIDSTSIFSTVKKILKSDNNKDRINKNIIGFHFNFNNTENNELEYINEIEKFTNNRVIIKDVNIEDINFENIQKSIFDTECISETNLGPWIIYKTMKENGFSVSLDGHGIDELLGGYEKHFLRFKLNEKKNHFFHYFKNKIFGNYKFNPKYGVLNDTYNSELFYDFHIGSLRSILRNFDRASMAHGVEVRSPFLYWKLISFIFSLPSGSKMNRDYSKTILRDAMKENLPKKILKRQKKIGFDTPKSFINSEHIRKNILDICNSRDFKEFDIFDTLILTKINKALESKKNIFPYWRYIQTYVLVKEFKKFSNQLDG